MKYRILLSLLLCIGILPVQAQTDDDIFQYSVDQVPNVKLIDANAYVSDPEDIIEVAYKDSINQVLRKLEDSTGVQCAVVVVPAVIFDEINSFSHQLFQQWGIGSKEKNDGLLILLLTDPDVREIKFQTGYGLEGPLPDAMCKRIQTTVMIPLMMDGDYGAGLLAGVRAVYGVLGKEAGLAEDSVAQGLGLLENPVEEDEIGWGYMALGILIAVLWLALGAWMILQPISTSKKNLLKKPNTNPLAAYSSFKNSTKNIGCSVFVLFFPLIPLYLIAILSYKRKLKKRALICPKCGKMMKTNKSKVVKEPTYSAKGQMESSATCPNCGHIETCTFEIPKKYKSSGSSSSSGGYSSSSSGGGGGSWGGGSSGGGGASTRF